MIPALRGGNADLAARARLGDGIALEILEIEVIDRKPAVT
jgi:hypothetical protein